MVLFALPLVASEAVAQTGRDAPVRIDMPAQALREAIEALTRQTGLRIRVDSSRIAGMTAPALQGMLTPRRALERLLAGSGIQIVDEGESLMLRVQAVRLREIEVFGRDPRVTESTGSYTREEMTTATGINLSVRETPQSVSVVTRERIDDQALRTITDVATSTTGISTRAYDSERRSYGSRGFEITNTLIDGVPTTSDPTWAAGESEIDTQIYDRVEVVRGATGLVAGPGNPSAAINLVRKRARSRTFTGTAGLQVGSWDLFRGNVDLSGPLAPNGDVRGRLVGAYQTQDSYVDLARTRRSVLYGVIGVDLSPRTLLTVNAGRQGNRPKGSTWGGLPIWYADGSRADWNVSKTTAASWSNWSSVHVNYSASLRHGFANGWTAGATYERGQYEANMQLLYLFGNPDRTTGLGMSAFPGRYDTSRLQDDIYLNGGGPLSLFGRTHELGFGLLGSRQRFVAETRDPVDVADVGDFNAWDGAYPEPEWGPSRAQESFTTNQLAGYAVARVAVAEPLKLVMGARLSSWDIEGDLFAEEESYDIDHRGIVTPYAGIVYDIDTTHSAYASYADIFRPQMERDRAGRYLDPINGATYEVGLKGGYFEERLNVALGLFRIVQDNAAQPDPGQIVPGTVDEQAYVAARGATSTGYEVDVSGRLAPGWQASVGWSHFRARDEDDAQIQTVMPRRQLKLFTRYQLGRWLSGLVVGGGVNWQSSNHMVVENTLSELERVDQPAFALVNLMARYAFGSGLALQVNVDNVLNETYYSQIGFYSQLAYGPPRNASLTVRYAFR